MVSIFAYSGIFNAQELNYPIHSQCGQCISTGLSRAFSELVRFRISSALKFNPYSLQLFLFFLFQLIWRGFLSIATKKITTHKMLIIDLLITIPTFIISFFPFIQNVF